ncbi:MAG: hypothetical protein ACPHID_07460 [Thermoplasmatota archaeon]
MVNLRCSKCGSHSGFLIETSGGQTLDVKGTLGVERIKATVRCTCTYCNNVWDHVPVKLVDTSVESRMGRHVMH